MKIFSSFFVGLFVMSLLTGCIGEDYDVGVPTAYIEVTIGSNDLEYPLTKANIIWESSSGKENHVVKDIEEFGLKQEEIWVFANQAVRFVVKENEENGGDSWPNSISIKRWKDGEKTNIDVNENGEFKIPDIEGNYLLEVLINNSTNRAQYLGNVVISKQK